MRRDLSDLRIKFNFYYVISKHLECSIQRSQMSGNLKDRGRGRYVYFVVEVNQRDPQIFE